MKFKIIGFKPKPIKLTAQKSPSRFSSMLEKDVALKSAKRVFGEAPEYMGMSTTSMYKLAAESKASKMENRVFFSTLKKNLKESRLRTASGVKQLRSSGKIIPKLNIFKAKTKGALKSYQSANVKSEKAFRKLVKKYTSEEKASIFKKPIQTENKKPYSLDTREIQYLKKIKKDMGF